MLKTDNCQINNPWNPHINGMHVDMTRSSSKEDFLKQYPMTPNECFKTTEEKGILTEYLEKNTKSIAGIKEVIVEIAKELKKIGFVALMEKDPLIDNPENLIQEVRNQDAELQLIQSHINTVIEFLKVSV